MAAILGNHSGSEDNSFLTDEDDVAAMSDDHAGSENNIFLADDDYTIDLEESNTHLQEIELEVVESDSGGHHNRGFHSEFVNPTRNGEQNLRGSRSSKNASEVRKKSYKFFSQMNTAFHELYGELLSLQKIILRLWNEYSE